MSEELLDIVRFCLLALVYLTFFRVLRVIGIELRTESPTASPVVVAAPSVLPAVAPVPRPSLVVLAPAAYAGTVYGLHEEVTLGRALDCGVVIDDQRVSKLHARVFRTGGRWAVEDLGSTNGTLLNGHVLDRPCTLGPDDRIQIGEHVLALV